MHGQWKSLYASHSFTHLLQLILHFRASSIVTSKSMFVWTCLIYILRIWSRVCIESVKGVQDAYISISKSSSRCLEACRFLLYNNLPHGAAHTHIANRRPISCQSEAKCLSRVTGVEHSRLAQSGCVILLM